MVSDIRALAADAVETIPRTRPADNDQSRCNLQPESLPEYEILKYGRFDRLPVGKTDASS